IEPSAIGQVKIQGMPALASLPQDRENLFYYNVREIPPQSDKPMEESVVHYANFSHKSWCKTGKTLWNSEARAKPFFITQISVDRY
ncbi:fimbria/pilus periplasmic chaperone, partial [Salmonella enterica subsp. enterica serovar Kentucky]|nr:fimbria/pilus periplasmic chaperone [Salmonella enterica subsp. enterica serovar Kentucky]